MSMKKNSAFLCAAAIFIVSNVLNAQDGAYSSYSPYSIFGMGNLSSQGTAYTNSMGGVGIATRNNRFINPLNPASVTARDTLSFMLDFGLSANCSVYRKGDFKTADNVFNINSFIFSVPIYKKSALMAGIMPFSSTGYDFSYDITDPEVIASTGNVNYSSKGKGGMYEIFLGGGVTFWNRLSVGAQVLYYFGNIDKTTMMDFEQSSYRDISSGYDMNLRAVGGKFGVQYDQPLSSGYYMTLGATYRTPSKIRGYVTDYKYASISSVSDTLHYQVDTLKNGPSTKIAGEIGIGLAIRKGDKWRLEVDYTASNWKNSNLESVTGFANVGENKFSTTFSHSVKAGFEIVPNRNDIRYYFRRCSYRVGAYYNKDYFKLNDYAINSYGITLGFTLPVFRWYNGVSVGVDLGQRGCNKNGRLKENYAKFVIGFNIHDIWFQKPKYD